MSAKVLLIDDDSIIRILASRALQRQGIEADVAVTAEEAIRLLQHSAHGIVIVDLYLPGMNGFALLDWLKQHQPGVVPIVLSGTTRMEDVIQAIQHGAFDFITKPIDQYEVFVQQVRRAIEHKILRDNHERLVHEIQEKNVELENRLGQLEMAHSVLQAQARAVQASLRRAQQIQRQLLPAALPFHDQVSLGVYYQPADKVGGDIYDVFQLDDRHLGLYVADTSGHGLGSALITMFLKYAFVPVEHKEGQSRLIEPGQLLRQLNTRFCEGPLGRDLFVSITYIILDMKTLELKFANAGHPPLLVRHPDGTIEQLRVPAPALGLNPHVKHATAVYQMQPGDLLVAYTDGVTDAQNAEAAFYGRARLREFIASAPPEPEAFIQAFDKDLSAFRQPAPLADDTTLIALGLMPQSSPVIEQHPVWDQIQECDEDLCAGLSVGSEAGITYVSVTGAGTWRESRHVTDLYEEARHRGDQMFVLDFAHCTHLDSTFYGVLHNLCTEPEKAPEFEVQLQNIPQELLREISELGLTTVLLRFRSAPRPLPKTMSEIRKTSYSESDMGQFLLAAHEALVTADPRNADRFAAVIKVLHDRTKQRSCGEKPVHV